MADADKGAPPNAPPPPYAQQQQQQQQHGAPGHQTVIGQLLLLLLQFYVCGFVESNGLFFVTAINVVLHFDFDYDGIP